MAGRALSDAANAEIAIMMVEAGGSERSFQYYDEGAPQVTEEVLADGLEAAKTWIRESIVLQRQLVEKWVAERGPVEIIPYSTFSDYEDDVFERVQAVGTDAIAEANTIVAKAERNAALDAATAFIIEAVAAEFPDRGGEIKAAVRGLTKKLVRKRIVEEGLRIDGRTTTEIRPLSAEVDLFPTAHGSALFQRGETQVLNVTTLGMPRMNQLLDTITPDEHKRYMHHYNFPPFSTGETGFMRGPKRREIGHGLLAERALLPVVPYEEDFPYTLRLVSDVLASNGSTSMASVCGSTLSMMAAGVPLKAPVAGIAMGLVYDGGTYVTLTDILGAEDAFGDMDFKVAGTKDVVTALQLDTKIDGLPLDVLTKALLQAKDARLPSSRSWPAPSPSPGPRWPSRPRRSSPSRSPWTRSARSSGPRARSSTPCSRRPVPTSPSTTTAWSGTVTIGAKDGTAVEEARRRIETILDPPLAEVGATYQGKVVNITKFGAFVNILPGRDGLLHISKIGQGKRVERVEDVLELGQPVEVKVDDIDPQGKVSLSLAGEAPAGAASGGESGTAVATVAVRAAVTATAGADPGATMPTRVTGPTATRRQSESRRSLRSRILRGRLRGGAGPGVRRSGPGRDRVVRSPERRVAEAAGVVAAAVEHASSPGDASVGIVTR